ncbi:hypothetical protein D9M70_572830 [compost metagenome]
MAAQGILIKPHSSAWGNLPCLLACLFRCSLHGLLADFRPGLRLSFFVHRHFSHSFHGASGPFTVRIRLGVIAVRRCVCRRRRSCQRPAPTPASQYANHGWPGVDRGFGGGDAVADSPLRSLCWDGADFHADLYDRHHHYQTRRQFHGHERSSGICRDLDLSRRCADVPLRWRDQHGDQPGT